MAQWIDNVMWWLETSYIPLWVVMVAVSAYFCVKFIQETRLPPPK